MAGGSGQSGRCQPGSLCGWCLADQRVKRGGVHIASDSICQALHQLAMAVTPTELLGAAAFPLILLAGVAALASIIYSRAGRMEPDDWIAAMLVRMPVDSTMFGCTVLISPRLGGADIFAHPSLSSGGYDGSGRREFSHAAGTAGFRGHIRVVNDAALWVSSDLVLPFIGPRSADGWPWRVRSTACNCTTDRVHGIQRMGTTPGLGVQPLEQDTVRLFHLPIPCLVTGRRPPTPYFATPLAISLYRLTCVHIVQAGLRWHGAMRLAGCGMGN